MERAERRRLLGLTAVSVLGLTALAGFSSFQSREDNSSSCEVTKKLAVPVYVDVGDSRVTVTIYPTDDGYRATGYDTPSGFDMMTETPIPADALLTKDNNYTSMIEIDESKIIDLRVNHPDKTVTLFC